MGALAVIVAAAQPRSPGEPVRIIAGMALTTLLAAVAALSVSVAPGLAPALRASAAPAPPTASSPAGTGSVPAPSGASPAPPKSVPAPPPKGPPPPAAPAPPTARLRVSDRNPRQNHGIELNATGSAGETLSYAFSFGDGLSASSYSPLALHGYREPGTYRATVVVVDKLHRTSKSRPVTIHVRDGLPPVVSIGSPRPNQRVRLGPSGLLLQGRARDTGGVRRVELAIQLAEVAGHPPGGPKGECVWYDGHHGLVFSPCVAPYFFRAHFARTHWRFRIDPHALIPPGTYVVRVRATDRAGNVSDFFTVALRTILPFRLVRR